MVTAMSDISKRQQISPHQIERMECFSSSHREHFAGRGVNTRRPPRDAFGMAIQIRIDMVRFFAAGAASTE
jgi:hypothetical protein